MSNKFNKISKIVYSVDIEDKSNGTQKEFDDKYYYKIIKILGIKIKIKYYKETDKPVDVGVKNQLRKIFNIKNIYIVNNVKIKEITFLKRKHRFVVKNNKSIENSLVPFSNYKHTPNKPVYLSIGAILKNEAPYVKEWIEYHKLIGVERFYLYDNESTDNIKEILKPYIENGTVIYRYITGEVMQLPCYNDLIYNYQDETQWMAVIDIDEFIVPIEKDSLVDFLKDFEKYPAVGINWCMFDSNDLKKQTDDLVIEKFTRTHKNIQCQSNRHIKSIVNPKKVIGVHHPHFFDYKNNEYAVDENFQPIDGKYLKVEWMQENAYAFTRKVSYKKIQINHYFCKSEEEYIKKIERGRPDLNIKRKFELSNLIFENTRTEKSIYKYLDKLKSKLKNSL